MATDSNSKLRITIETNPPNSRLEELNVKYWPKWAGPPGKYHVKYEAEQICYLLKGKVKVYPRPTESSSEFVEFGAGDLVIFPEGLCCTWEVFIAVDKYYKFEPPCSSSSSP
ncbi:hypothetical protein TanjilG_32423 [Lupinus angustifolius]|uniref:(S)-ureidoglycine aminohydrolase cupin domain-containing protein n=1 Tax=Lupinus angustifolius TaxID=3871 RepID=A0A394DDK7_LUPAN|nr:PREDICTED: uncharacterized protein LOC109339721 [Lupinus angustifolius]OIW21332.1 hypothetical protein TanjilG_32423 [Lupinus angustifolius]